MCFLKTWKKLSLSQLRSDFVDTLQKGVATFRVLDLREHVVQAVVVRFPIQLAKLYVVVRQIPHTSHPIENVTKMSRVAVDEDVDFSISCEAREEGVAVQQRITTCVVVRTSHIEVYDVGVRHCPSLLYDPTLTILIGLCVWKRR